MNLGNDRGFVLVGGQADEIIGYCDHGEFDAELMPANMRSWLDSYMAAATLTVLKSWLFTDPDNTGDYTTRSDESSSPFFEGNGYLVYPAMNSHNHNGFDAEFELGCRIVKNDGSVTRDFAWATYKFAVDNGLNDHSKPVYLNPLTDPALTDGDYALHFTSRLKGSDTWLLDSNNENHYVAIHRPCPRQTHCHFGVKVAAACIQRYQVQLTHSRGNEAISC